MIRLPGSSPGRPWCIPATAVFGLLSLLLPALPAAALPPTYDLVFLGKPIKVNEGDLANIDVQLVGANCIGWSGVDWSTSAAPAPANPLPAELSDFQNPSPFVVGFSSGAGETVTVQLQTVVDSDAEDDVVSLTLSSSNPEITCSTQFPTFSSYSVDVIIVDSAPPPTARISSSLGVGVLERNVPAAQPEIQVEVTLDNPPPPPFSYHVKLGTLDQSAAAPGDYETFLADVHFQDGDAGPFVFTIKTNPDNVPENDEGFLIKLFNPDPGLDIHADHAVNVTITNDDATPQVAVLDPPAWPEGSGGGSGIAMITVQVTDAPIGVPFDIHWQTDDSATPPQATAGVDYQAVPPTIVTLTADSSTDTIDLLVPVVRDNDPEDDETFQVVVLSASFGASLNDADALVTIADDDVAQLATVDITDNGPQVEGDAGTTIMNFTVTLTGTPPAGSTVHYSTLDDTAVAGQDYQATSGTLQFGGANPGVQTIQVAVIGDQAVEGLETFFVKLDNPDGLGIGIAKATGTIDDDDSPVPPPQVSIEGVTLAEGDSGESTANFTVSLSAPSASPVSFSWTTFDGSATSAGNDYLAAAGNILIPGGETSVVLAVQVLGDNLVEPNETFEVVLADLAGGVFADDRAAATITNDDVQGEFSFSVGDVSITEGDAGLKAATFTVVLTEARGVVPTVDYSTVAGSASAESDYQPASGQLVFSDGATSKTITVNIAGDTAVEPDETFTVQLANPTGGATLGDSSALGTILNDDAEAPPTPILSVEDAEVAEGDSGTTQVVFQLRLDRAADGPVTASYATFDGSATTADQDYQGQTGQVLIPAGATTATVSIQAIGDSKVEPDESFGLALSNVAGAELGRAQAAGRLRNDDEEAPPVEGSSIRLLRAGPVAEGAGFAVVVVERFGAAVGSASARVVALAGSAAAGDDFTPVDQEVSWGAGATGEREVRVPLVADNRQEGDETIRVAIAEISGARAGQPLEGELVILDDDSPLRLELVGAAERDLTVGQELDLQVRAVREDGMPVAGALIDFEAQSGPVRLLGEGPSPTDGDGVATRRVAVGPAPGTARVRAVLRGSEAEAAFLLRVAGNLGELGVGSGGDRNVGDILDQSCATATGQLAEACAYLYGLEDPADRRQALAELTPQGVVAQLRSALQAPKNQNRNVGTRLDALRGGGPLQTLDQLSMSVQGQSIGGVGALQQSLLRGAAAPPPRGPGAPRTSPGLDQQIDRDNGWEKVRERDGEKVELALYKARHGHAPLAKQDAASGQSFDYGDESRWGMFVNGRMSFGDAPRRGADPGYDFETDGLTAGVDYRLNDQMVIGAALGWVSTSSELADGGGIDTDGWSLSLYGTWYRDQWYVEGVLGYGRNDYDFKRVILLPEIFQGRDTYVAVGSPKSDQLSAELGAGYDFRLGPAATLSGFGRFSYVDTAIDGYSETGGGPFDLAFADQELDSLLGEAGVEITYPWSVGWGVLQPMLRVSFLHEFEDDAQVIRARFLADGSQRFFVVRAERPDRDYMNLAAGISATLPRGWATFLQYDTDLEREELDIYTLSGGFRFQF